MKSMSLEKPPIRRWRFKFERSHPLTDKIFGNDDVSVEVIQIFPGDPVKGELLNGQRASSLAPVFMIGFTLKHPHSLVKEIFCVCGL